MIRGMVRMLLDVASLVRNAVTVQRAVFNMFLELEFTILVEGLCLFCGLCALFFA